MVARSPVHRGTLMPLNGRCGWVAFAAQGSLIYRKGAMTKAKQLNASVCCWSKNRRADLVFQKQASVSR